MVDRVCLQLLIRRSCQLAPDPVDAGRSAAAEGIEPEVDDSGPDAAADDGEGSDSEPEAEPADAGLADPDVPLFDGATMSAKLFAISMVDLQVRRPRRVLPSAHCMLRRLGSTSAKTP